MIAIRICSRCRRTFDVQEANQRKLCPLCEQGELFLGEFTDEAVCMPDIRASVEEPYKQSVLCKKKLMKMFAMDCTMAWEKDAEEDTDDEIFFDNTVLQQIESVEEDFVPLLAPEDLRQKEVRAGTYRGTSRPTTARQKRKEPPELCMQRRGNPYKNREG